MELTDANAIGAALSLAAVAQEKMFHAKRAADAILAPLTAEVGRLLEENPGADVLIVCFGEEIKLTAKHFTDLYDATDI